MWIIWKITSILFFIIYLYKRCVKMSMCMKLWKYLKKVIKSNKFIYIYVYINTESNFTSSQLIKNFILKLKKKILIY